MSSVDSDGKVSFDLNKATQTSITNSATAVGRTITLNADSGTGSSQSLSNGNVSFAVSGATGDYISTTMDGSAVKVSTKRATINSDANTGAASVTGADGLATAKNVASAINNTNTVLSNKIAKIHKILLRIRRISLQTKIKLLLTQQILQQTQPTSLIQLL